MNIGIIGAGSIAKSHLSAYKSNPKCTVKAIADINGAAATELAGEYAIPDVYTDYRELLADESIEAVSIATPTFTHKDIVLDAIKASKHILCEKPPALNAEETRECVEAAEKSDKFFMYAFVCRFNSAARYLKEYIDSGKMGKVLSADGARIATLSASGGWFNSRGKGGGVLRDAAIHELDLMLFFMNYPSPKSVLAFSDNSNKHLLDKVNTKTGWVSKDTSSYKRDIEDFIRGFITFENGSCISINAASVFRTVEPRRYVEVNGDMAGARLFANKKPVEITEITDDWTENCFAPAIEMKNSFEQEISYFIDCCEGKENTYCRPRDAIRLMEIIDALYKSAETGEPVIL